MAAPMPVSAKDPIRFTPSVYESDPEKPVYLIRPPTLYTKPRWERDLTASGAVYVSREKTTAFLRDAVNALLEGDAKRAALDDLERAEELQGRDAESGPLSDAEKAELVMLVIRLAELGDWAGRQWPPYAELVAQQEYWWTMSLLLAAKHFCCGWENVSESCAECTGSGKIPAPAAEPAAAVAETATEAVPTEPLPQPPCTKCKGSGKLALKFKLRDGLVDPDVLERLPRADVRDIGLKARTLMRVDDERRKN